MEKILSRARIRILLLCKRYVAARKKLDELLFEDTFNSWLLYYLFLCLREESKYELAQGYLRRALELEPGKVKWRRDFDQLLERSHKFDLYISPTAEQVAEYGITTVLHLSGPNGVGYQGNMWLSVLEQLDEKVAVVIRDKWIAKELNATSMPVFFMRTAHDLEALSDAGVKVVLYPGNPQKNTQMLRFAGMQHYFINHGESDKVVNQSKLLRAYDKLLVAGPLAQERLQTSGLRFWPDQIEHVGRPQVALKLSRVESPCTSVKTVLYAPTWEGFTDEANYTSVGPLGLGILHALSQRSDLRIIFKPHPYTGTTERTFYANYLRQMQELCGQHENLELVSASEDIHDSMNASDLLITDISSTVNDYLYTQKPIILAQTYGYLDISGLSSVYPSTAGAYLLRKPEGVSGLIDHIIKDDSAFTARQGIAERSLGGEPQMSLQKFDDVVSRGVKGNKV